MAHYTRAVYQRILDPVISVFVAPILTRYDLPSCGQLMQTADVVKSLIDRLRTLLVCDVCRPLGVSKGDFFAPVISYIVSSRQKSISGHDL